MKAGATVAPSLAQVEVQPEKVSICHCLDCQRLTGTAFGRHICIYRDVSMLKGKPTE